MQAGAREQVLEPQVPRRPESLHPDDGAVVSG